MEERVFPVEIEVPGFQCGLMETLYGLWQRGQLCDAVIHTSNGSVEAHRAVLCAASPYLHNMEVSDRQQFRVSHYHLQVGRLEDVTVILRLFYTGKFAVSSENVENLMQLCLFLQVGEAVKVCQRFFNGWHSQKGQTTRNLPESLFLLENKLGLRDGSPNIPVGVSIQGYSQLPNTSPHNSPGTESVQQDQLNVHTDQHYTHVDRNQQAAVDMSNAYDVHMCVSRENHISCDSTRHEGQRSPVTISSQDLTFLQKVRRSDPDDSLDGQRSMQIPNDCDEDTEKLASRLLANDVDNLSNSSTSDTQGFVNSSLSEDVTKKEGETKRSQSSPNINTSPLSPEVDDSYSKFNSDNLTSHQQWPINCRDGNEKVQNRSSFSQHKKLCHSKSSTFDSSKSLSTNDELGSSLECNEDNVSTLCTDSGNTIKKMEKTIDSKTINTCSLRSNLRSKHGSENLKSNKHAKKRKLGPTSDGKNQEKVDTSKPKVQRVKGRDPVNIATRTKTKRGSKDTKKQAQANVICTLCKLVFTSKMERAKHKREVHKLKPDGYKCAVCKGTFSTLHQLKTHKEQAHPEKIRCFKCDGHPSFSTVSELENHRRNQHVRDQTIICRICRETFATRDAKNDHVKKVHPYGKNCPECNTKFDNWKHLVDHRNHKHNVPFEANKYEIFSCDIENCDYQTVDKYRYLCHKRDVHCCDRSHTCLTCNSTFKSKRALKSHQEVHLDRDQRNGSQCDQCGKKFLSVTYLKTHIDTMHSEEKKPIKKQFLCHLCPNSFRDKHFFHSHMLRAHEVAPPADLKLHRCTHCDFFTVQKSHLRKHMRHHSTEAKEYECNSCGKKFLTEDCLGRHIQRHQMKDEFCPIPGCGYSTKYKSNLKNHVARIHTQKDLKPFLCPYCDYRCKEKGNLNKHITGKHKMEVVTVAKLRKNAIKTGTGYPNFVTMSQSNTAASYSEEENMESQVNMAMTMSASYNQYQLDYNMQVYNGVT